MLDHVKEQQNNLRKGLLSIYGSEDTIEKGGKRATIGEVRTWGNEKWVKHQDGWVHVHPTTSKATLEKPGEKKEEKIIVKL